MIPKKLGEALGHEMLLSAKNYHGGILRNRGTQVAVVKKVDVIPYAMDLAKELADKLRT